MSSVIRSAVLLFFLTLILGVGYPLLMTGVGKILFPRKSEGSLISGSEGYLGSALIGQAFTSDSYFHSRPSKAGDGCDAANSQASNLGPTSQKLLLEVEERVKKYREINLLDPNAPVPADAVTASGSGLDPHISIPNAKLQAKRIALARRLPEEAILKLIDRMTEGRSLGIFGEERVNVLKLNLALQNTSAF